MKEFIKNVSFLILLCTLSSLSIYLFFKPYSLSLIWILSPFWEIVIMLLFAIILSFFYIIISAIVNYIRTKKENKDAEE